MAENIIAAAERPSETKTDFNWPTFIIEVVIIVVAALYATSVFADFDPAKRLGGIEAEYLTRTVYPVISEYEATGRIPLWDPYMELGDPMLTNPVAFYFNPVLMGPSFLFGPNNGIKVSIILSALVAGFGGWAIGRVLGLGPLARLLLALLCIGKGNMPSFLSQGHFAFFASQAYFPWIYAGVLAIFRGYRRWPIVLTATAFALVFFTGSPWYPPALALTMGILTLFYVVHIRRDQRSLRLQVEWGKVAAVVAAFALTILLSAAAFLTIWNSRNAIGGTGILQDYRAGIGLVLSQYFSGVKVLDDPVLFPEGNSYAFYSYVIPVWFGLLTAALFAVVVVLRRRLPRLPWRLIGGGATIFLFCTLWGAGQNPIIEWFYQSIPLSNEFRHVERVLAISSMWLAVLAAVFVDSLWQYLVRTPVWSGLGAWAVGRGGQRMRRLVAVALIVIGGVASYDVISKWHESWGSFFVRPEDKWEDYCVSWLRGRYPDQPLAIWTLTYRNVITNYRNQVRHGFVGSDFYHAAPLPSTIFVGSLIPRDGGPTELLPEFAFGPPHYDQNWLSSHGYTAIPESSNPFVQDHSPCLYRREGAYSYAFWITRKSLVSYVDVLPADSITPITTVLRDYDRVAVLAQARTDDDVVVVAQELAFPGWQVEVDGETASLESVGGLIGVVLPPDGRIHEILFQYLPSDLFVGAAITLITAVGCILYLLRADRNLPSGWQQRFVAKLAEAWDLGRSDGA